MVTVLKTFVWATQNNTTCICTCSYLRHYLVMVRAMNLYMYFYWGGEGVIIKSQNQFQWSLGILFF